MLIKKLLLSLLVGYPLPNVLKTRDTLRFEAFINLVQTSAPIEYFYLENDYENDAEIIESLKIVGFVGNDFEEYNNNYSVYFGNYYVEMIGLEEQGLYEKAISFDYTNKLLLSSLVNSHFNTSGYSYRLQNEVMLSLDYINGLVETLSNVFIYIGLGFAVFASLMLLNFISISVSNKKQETGILRAIGARGKDVLGIFTKESMIIAIINFILALILTINAVIYVNIWFRNTLGFPITILSFGIRQIGLMLVVSLGVAFISSALPVIKTSRKRPIDAIREA